MSQFVKCLAIIIVAIFFAIPEPVLAQANVESDELGIKGAVIKAAELGETRNVHQLGNLYFAGKPDRNIATILKSKKIKRVISLCTDGEIKWDEKSSLENAGIEFIQMGIGSLDDLDGKFYAKIRTLLKQDDIPTLFHCASATRVGAAWLPYRVLDQGVDVEIAKAEAEIIGLRSKAFVEIAVSYIQRQQAETQDEKSVKPGINDNFKNPELDVDDFIKRFEIESREIYSSRKQNCRSLQLAGGPTCGRCWSRYGIVYSTVFSSSRARRLGLCRRYFTAVHRTHQCGRQRTWHEQYHRGIVCRQQRQPATRVGRCRIYLRYIPSLRVSKVFDGVDPQGTQARRTPCRD